MDSVMPLEDVLQYSTSKVFTGYQFRFNPGIMKVKEIIDRHEIGHPISFQCFWGEFLPGWHPWEDYRKSYAGSKEMGGGVVLTLSHPIDYLRWIFGEVLELFAVTGKISELEIDTEDMAEVLFTFENGVIGNLHLDYYSQPKRHDLVVTCTEGRVSWDYASSKVCIEKNTGEIVEIGLPQNYDRNQMFMDEMRHFLDVCNGAVQPICSFKDGKKALQIAWGILQSGKYKERVIFDR